MTDIQATKAHIVTCKEVIDEEVENRYQRVAGFLPIDGEATLEEIDLVKKVENADSEMDPFAGLYRIDAATESDDEDMDNRSEADMDPDEFEGKSGLQVGEPHSDGHRRQPPTVPEAQLALEDLRKLLHHQRRKQKGYGAKDEPWKTTLDPIILARLEDIRCYDPVLPPFYFHFSYLFSHMTLCHLIGHLTLVT